ncbi:MAG: hypothetical protein SVR94_09630 [Pseudomonadota bacterium]|nr:hypothetical protein [Pseudomonadota bacterium]
MRSIDNLALVEFNPSKSWMITYNQLHALDPTEVEDYHDTKYSLWAMFFVQDLLQIENKYNGLLIDVGWYPEADPTGCYKLILVKKNSDGFDWHNPKEEFATNNLNNLLFKINKLIS